MLIENDPYTDTDVYGDEGDDVIAVEGRGISGNEGDDFIIGGAYIYGDEGNDWIQGSCIDDDCTVRILGGDGHDRIYGG